MSCPGRLVPRAVDAQKPGLPYWDAFFKAIGDPWSAEQNPGGFIPMVIAENRLSCDMVQQRLAAAAADVPAAMLYYNDMRGIPEVRFSIAGMLQATFMKGVTVDPAHLSVLSGAAAVLDLLFHCIAAPGAGALIPAPYYPAFDNDLRVRNQVIPVAVFLDPQQQDYAAALDTAAAAAAAAGHPIAALLVTNPNNPTGTVYNKQQLSSMVGWCLKNKVHYVSDEIYANSVFDESTAFTSAAHILQEQQQPQDFATTIMQKQQQQEDVGQLACDLVHILFGFSKDFCASGIRVGCLYSKNVHLNKALDNLSAFCSTPCTLQWSLAQMLADESWLSNFLSENKKRLRDVYRQITGELDAAGIPYMPAAAAMFLWVDLRAALSSSSGSSSSSSSSGSWSEEAELWQSMVDKHKVVITPGSACHAAEPGWFRICWAYPPPESIPVAVARIVAAVQEHKQIKQQQEMH